jgi:hypothetical protein
VQPTLLVRTEIRLIPEQQVAASLDEPATRFGAHGLGFVDANAVDHLATILGNHLEEIVHQRDMRHGVLDRRRVGRGALCHVLDRKNTAQIGNRSHQAAGREAVPRNAGQKAERCEN